MKYSILKSGYKLTASGPFTPDGGWFDQYDTEADKPSHLVMIVPNEEFSRKIISASKLTDMLSTDDLNMCLSERCWATMQSFQIDPDANVFTTIVQDLKERLLANFVYVWSSAIRHRFLDRSRMGIDDFCPEDMPEPSEWVLDADALPPYDLFFGETRDWIITERLKRALKKTGFSNIEFASIGR
jgi:hypothetical protein